MLNVPAPKVVVDPPSVTSPCARLKVPGPKFRDVPLFVTVPEKL